MIDPRGGRGIVLFPSRPELRFRAPPNTGLGRPLKREENQEGKVDHMAGSGYLGGPFYRGEGNRPESTG